MRTPSPIRRRNRRRSRLIRFLARPLQEATKNRYAIAITAIMCWFALVNEPWDGLDWESQDLLLAEGMTELYESYQVTVMWRAR